MNGAVRLFALIALMPAALHGGPVRAGESLLVPICTGDGQTRLVAIPRDGKTPQELPASPDCAKGCHAGASRKRSVVPDFEPAQ